MRRVRYYEYGGPDVLRVEDAERPDPAEGEVLIRNEAIGANFIDSVFRRGAPEGSMFAWPLPGVLTGDVVGTIEAVGPGVDSARIGERVAALVARDAFADYSVADAEWLATVPGDLDAGSASMLAMAAPLALRALRLGGLAEGETVLVHAAAGGIGHLATQLAKILGAGTVIATASSPEKLDFARKHGADVGVDYTAADWAEQVRAAAPNGVDLVLDSVGGAVTHQSLDLLAPFGRAVVYGAAGGEQPTITLTGLYALRHLTGLSLLAWRGARPAEARQDIVDAAELMASGRLRTSVHTSLPLTEAAEAHRILDARAQLGRILLVP